MERNEKKSTTKNKMWFVVMAKVLIQTFIAYVFQYIIKYCFLLLFSFFFLFCSYSFTMSRCTLKCKFVFPFWLLSIWIVWRSECAWVQYTCKVPSPKSIRLLAIKNKIENLSPNEIGSDAFAFTKLKSLEEIIPTIYNVIKCDSFVLFFVSHQQKISRIFQIIFKDILHHSWAGSGSSNRNQK